MIIELEERGAAKKRSLPEPLFAHLNGLDVVIEDVDGLVSRLRIAGTSRPASVVMSHWRRYNRRVPPHAPKWFLIALFGLTQIAVAQTTLSGGVSASSQPSMAEIYAGQDPLKGHPETMPPASTGDCMPPAGWIVIYRTETTCYYFVPFKTPLQAKILKPAEAAKYRWTRCGEHPWDPSLIICFGTPVPKQGSRQSTGPLTASATTNDRYYDPCHPYSRLPAGQTLTAQAVAQAQQACNAERCKHNPELLVCNTTVSPTLPGDKGLKRDSPPGAQPSTKKSTPDPSAIYRIMNDCLRAKLPYMIVMRPQPQYMQQARYSASASVPLSTPLDQLPLQTQVFILATAAGLQAQAYHDSQYGPYSPANPNQSSSSVNGKDYLAGWLENCAETAGVISKGDPREAYAKLVGVRILDPRVTQFASGYHEFDYSWPPTLLEPPRSRR